ncbi:hypothetical protein E4U52_006696 [Claviceps spartinae]|nr:hypothetical protein E4U52_006696 [Claviceps spartinae]
MATASATPSQCDASCTSLMYRTAYLTRSRPRSAAQGAGKDLVTILIHEPVSKCLRSARSFKMRAKWRKKRVRRLKRKRRKMRARS